MRLRGDLAVLLIVHVDFIYSLAMSINRGFFSFFSEIEGELFRTGSE